MERSGRSTGTSLASRGGFLTVSKDITTGATHSAPIKIVPSVITTITTILRSCLNSSLQTRTHHLHIGGNPEFPAIVSKSHNVVPAVHVNHLTRNPRARIRSQEHSRRADFIYIHVAL